MTTFEQLLIEEIRRVRAILADDNMSAMRLSIVAHGRVQSGDLKIEFTLGGEYGEGNVTGDSIDAVIEEFRRRRGWSSRHNALAIGYNGEVKSDEIPF